MKHFLNLSFLSLVLAFGSCEEATNGSLSPGLNITIGQVCGWCSGQDELAMSQEIYSYYYDYGCGDSLDVPKKFFNTPSSEWEKLIGLLDKNEFRKIDLNTCNVCADGCDIWVIVEDYDYSHTIRFGNVDESPESQREFLSTLHKLIIEVREDLHKN